MNPIFGVDSSLAADTIYDIVVAKAGQAPKWWGRYLGNYAITAKEADFIHGKGSAIALVWNNLGYLDVASTYTWGITHAASAAAAARDLGVPANTILFMDIEGGWQPTSAFMTGYADGIANTKYLPGFYGAGNQAQFTAPYIAMRAAHTAPVYFWSSEPELFAWQDTVISLWTPTVPFGFEHDCIIWQYAEGNFNDIVDLDLCIDMSLLWNPVPVTKRRQVIKGCSLKPSPGSHTTPALAHIPARGQILDSGERTTIKDEVWASSVQWRDQYGAILANNIEDIPVNN